jgi:hypothetical protein
MILYHGSTHIVEKPIYGMGKLENDYGRGFYCTEDIDLAREWAAVGLEGGFVSEYSLDIAGMNCLNLNDGNYNILNWLAILMDNRKVRITSPVEKRGTEYVISNFLPDITKSDIIIGYRADDSYFSFSRAFLSNTITIQQLAHAMKFGDLGIQVVLRSKKAFKDISFTKSYVVDGTVYYPKRMNRDNAARKAYQKLLEKVDRDGLYLSDIMREGVKNDDSGFFRTIS